MAALFSKIIRGELPCFKIFEDEHTFAFLDINPIFPGHSLIVPKIEVDYFVDVPEPYYSAVFQNAKKIARAIQFATDCKKVGTAIVGLEVPYFHYHLVPMWQPGDLSFAKSKPADKAVLAEIQARILERLSFE